MAVIKRSIKGAPLTHAEMDGNMDEILLRATKSGTVLSDTLTVNTDALVVNSGKRVLVGPGVDDGVNQFQVKGSAVITGNTTLGDATTDTVTVNGYMGIGGSPTPSTGLAIKSTSLSGSGQYGVLSDVTVTSAAIYNARAFNARVNTPDAAFTVANLYSYYANNAIKGASSTITSLYGLYVEDQTRGTNNYGIASLVSSGANKWNIYASGTAANYFAGKLLIGTTTDDGVNKLQVNGSTSISGNLMLDNTVGNWRGFNTSTISVGGTTAAGELQLARDISISGSSVGAVVFIKANAPTTVLGERALGLMSVVCNSTATTCGGNMSFSTKPEGGTLPITAMTITNIQNVLIGTTTDDGVNKLQVNGSIAMNPTITTTAPSAGGAGALPATPTGYATMYIGGVARKIAYY